MKKIKSINFCIIFIALIICALLLYNRSCDIYSRIVYTYDFKTIHLEDYSGETVAAPTQIEESETSILGLYKTPISLKAGTYNTNFLYAAVDESSVLKVFATDYTNADNSPGKMLFYQEFDPANTTLNFDFTLDQNVDSVFFVIETTDENFLVDQVQINGSNYIYTDTIFYCIVTILIAIMFLCIINYKGNKIKPISFKGETVSQTKTMLFFVFACFIVVFMASLPTIDSKVVVGHDVFFHLNRIEGIKRALESGQFPVRVHGGTLNDYGYPNSLFYPELLFYFPAILSMLGVSITTSYKVLIITLNILGFISGYFSFKHLTKSRVIGLIATTVFLLNPYRLVCLYYRAAIGESIAMTFLPIVIYGLYAVIWGNKKHWWVLVLGATAILQTHILSTQLTVYLAGILALANIKCFFTKENRWLALVKAAISTLLINIWFIAPMLILIPQLGLKVFTNENVAPPSFFGTLTSGFIFAISKIQTFGPHPVGLVLLAAFVLYVIYRFVSNTKPEHKVLVRLGDQLAVLGAIFVIAQTNYFPWKLIESIPIVESLFPSIQFEYRFLTLAQICLAVVLAINFVLWFTSSNARIAAGITVISFSILFTVMFYESVIYPYSYEFLYNKHYHENNLDNGYSVSGGEYLVEGVRQSDIENASPVIESDNTSLEISNLTRHGTRMEFSYNVELQGTDTDYIELPITYIPNYTVKLNGEEVSTIKTLEAKVAFIPTSSTGDVTVYYAEPLTFRVFELISLVATLVVIFRNKFFDILQKLIKPKKSKVSV